MNCMLTQSWTILLPLDESSPNYLSEHKLFVVESGKSFLRKIGGGMEDYSIRPEVLRPTVVFHNALAKHCKRLGFAGKKFPYAYYDGSLNVKIHYYFEKYVVLTVAYKENSTQLSSSLKDKTTLSNSPAIEELCLLIGGLILSGNHRQYAKLNAVPTFSCTSIKHTDLGTSLLDNKTLVESLTGHVDPTERMVEDVLSRNVGHQINSALTLIDKQGVLQQLPADYVGTKESLKKYESCCNLFELMLVINAALKDKILDNNNVFFKSIKELVNFPENIVQSFTARRTIEQFVRDFHLSNALMVLEEKQQIVQQNQVPVKSKTLRDGWNEFYASKEFFSVIATSIAAGVTGTLALFWAYLHTL
ncbi:hypothetical protein FPW41_00720 [Vibrio cholerae]|nr:hypothetical protein [Vibrio cholerae]TQP07520.1 hypothetical protein FLM03_19460 [Vibrio cholerae]TQP18485.1 hypothetical protein FLL94_19490 [Vibrio cholerae]TVN42962.1 hypothetical protein FPW41_00720 [Vibrio cholerae]HDZ9290774.1 hypothetical protein [Vibrio cholerae]